MASSSVAALRGYRRLLRTVRGAFANDVPALTAAKVEIRAHFEENKGENEGGKIDAMINDIEDVVQFLNQNVVQAQLDPNSGDYRVKIEDSQARALSTGDGNHVNVMSKDEKYGVAPPVQTTCRASNPKQRE
jgi:hypothetical protein